MKLLSPREVETHHTANTTAESQRITAIRSHLTREERELNDWNDSVEKKKQSAIQDFEKKIGIYNVKIRDLQEKIDILEEKREILLKPLDDTPELITERLAVTENLLDYLRGRKKELSEAKKQLESSQKEADKQLNELLDKERVLNERELSIQKRLRMVKGEEEKLAQSVEQFSTESNRKNISLMMFENKLNKHEVELAEREKLVAEGNEKIAMDRKRIESQQQSLIAALAEIKNKN